jgi:insecticidal toxin complex protein TccC
MAITFNHLNDIPTISLIEPYCQTYTYDTGNNLTHLSHQANSGDWQHVVFATFAENVGANVQSAVLLLCLVG